MSVISLTARLEKLERADTSGGGPSLTEIMTAAVGLNERLFRMDSQALIKLSNDVSEPPSTRVQGIRRLLSREIDGTTKLSLLRLEQAMTQADLKEAQEREITSRSRKYRILQERMKYACIRVATYRLDEISKEISTRQA